MRTALAVIPALALLAVAVADARADDPDPDRVTSYRAWTIGVDVTPQGAFLLSGYLQGDGYRDTAASTTLGVVGVFGASLGTPFVHVVRGHLDRALGSFLLRSVLGGAGGLIGVHLADDDPALWGLEGMMAGLAVAGAIDAIYMTDERGGRSGWGPQIVVTGDRVQLGVAAAF